MGIAVRKHNSRAQHKNWWRRYFWSQDEYWAKHAVTKAAHRARVAKAEGNGSYYFWSQVSLRAAAYCEREFGPVPKLLLRRPIGRSVWSLSSPDVHKWLSIVPPFRRKREN
jgi:hypothetical protein